MAKQQITLTQAAFTVGAVLLATAPVIWVINTWRDPAFASNGGYFFLVVLGLFLWSVTSARLDGNARRERVALVLLVITALVRLAGQVLAIDTIGALALTIDVYAIARLLKLSKRKRSLSPAWLAVAFGFCLPLERIAQRCIGYALQEISARGACGLLRASFEHVACEGVRIGVNGADVMVDLPCSGSQALVAFGFVFAVTATLTRPRWAMGGAGMLVAIIAAIGGNVVRIALLASALALGPARLGFNAMAQPWHDLIGLSSLGFSSCLLLLWARAVKSARPALSAPPPPARRRFGLGAGLAFCAVAFAVIVAPRQPLDVGTRAISISPPSRIGAFSAVVTPLTPAERTYFQQYGGAAVKAQYGPYALLLTRTSAPLRHLHAPDECLRGLGYRVEYAGLKFTPAPSAQYRAVAPDGRAYDIETSFISNTGRVAASVSEAVWIWLGDRSTVWTAVQRIAPAGGDARAQAAFDLGVAAALDLPSTPISFAPRE